MVTIFHAKTVRSHLRNHGEITNIYATTVKQIIHGKTASPQLFMHDGEVTVVHAMTARS